MIRECGALFFLLLAASPAFATGKHVDWMQIDESNPAPTENTILPKAKIMPFLQWDENDGYCGELSSIEAGMGLGQWMSQFNGRAICGTGLSQSGPDGFCAANKQNPNYNAQFLFEDMNPGDERFASAPVCLTNAHFTFTTFDHVTEAEGMDGYRQYMSWIKSRIIAGDTVAIAVLNRGGTDPQYDHEVTVSKIGTNHAANDPTYYDDDVIYLESHGPTNNSFVYGYKFSDLANTRTGANTPTANIFSILIPGSEPVLSVAGGDGIHINPHPILPRNYGFAVSGLVDPKHELLPVSVEITGSVTDGVNNKADPILGFNFEKPEIGGGDPNACTNVAPAWMQISLEATVSDLTPGVKYNLYEYELNGVSGIGSQASLPIPDEDFNAHANQATAVTSFTAESTSFTHEIETTSDKIVVFRCVRADSP
jgi:hypothetical protein